jgi:type IV pilus assembly protein PilV
MTQPTSQASRSRRAPPALHAARARGFTLIEVMVSLIVLSIGLLGIGKLVLFSARANDSAYLRGQATEMAYEILDNMRANRQIAVTQGYDTPLATVPPNPGSCITAVCAPATLGLYDVYTWKTHLAVLPSGQGSVVTAGNPTTATITVQWDDAAAQSTFGGTAVGVAAPQSVVLETIL